LCLCWLTQHKGNASCNLQTLLLHLTNDSRLV
jgi:hypothetical protein